jgi:hypothetical protein
MQRALRSVLSMAGQTGTSQPGEIYSPYFGTKQAFPVMEFLAWLSLQS